MVISGQHMVIDTPCHLGHSSSITDDQRSSGLLVKDSDQWSSSGKPPATGGLSPYT